MEIVRIFICNEVRSPSAGDLSYRFTRTVANPEAYTNYRSGEKLVVNGVHEPRDQRKIVGKIVEVLNDPEKNTRDFFVELNKEDYQFLTTRPGSEWTLIENL